MRDQCTHGGGGSVNQVGRGCSAGLEGVFKATRALCNFALLLCVVLSVGRSPAPQAASRMTDEDSSRGGDDQADVILAFIEDGATHVACPCRGPRAALKVLKSSCASAGDMALWLEEARISAVMGTCQGSLKSVRSGLQCYIAFMRHIMPGIRRMFPPKAAHLQAWSRLFRCAGTFGNYMSYVRTGCMVLGVDTQVFNDPALRRAKKAVASANAFTTRPRMWIRRGQLEEIMKFADVVRDFWTCAVLYLLAYVFLLRLPSEALPAVAGKGGGQSSLYREGDTLVLELARRKNKPRGSRLVRKCWCGESRATCPVHVIGPWLDTHPTGTPLFPDISPARALGMLRDMLATVGVEGHSEYRTHDLRRGHALDLQLSGK